MPTEWMVNSTSWAGKKAPYTIGVSRVYSEGAKDKPRALPINDVRGGQESIHHHAFFDKNTQKSQKQSEFYLFTEGQAVLGTLPQKAREKNKVRLTKFDKGDLVIIPGGTVHGIVAIDENYQHIVCQAPSAFQHGYKFKTKVKDISKNLEQEACRMLIDSPKDKASVKTKNKVNKSQSLRQWHGLLPSKKNIATAKQ